MYLGIDIGTSGVKAVAMDAAGVVHGQGEAPLHVARPQPDWSEQDPSDWWKAVETSVLAVDPRVRGAVRAIGLAGQMHGATLLDSGDQVLRPAILWNDGRSFAQCAALEAVEPASRRITGNIAMPGFTAPKLLWVRDNEPEIFDRIASVLLPKDYVRLCMTGDKASDMSDGAGTLWLDPAARRWSGAMLHATGLTEASMPVLHEGTEPTGVLRAEVAARWGMARVPVTAGGGDNAAGAVGVGVVKPGDAFLSLGTSGVIFVTTDAFQPNPDRAVHAFCHCLPDIWHQMSVHLSAASCIDWAAGLLGLANPAKLFALAEEAGIASGDELFLPYLSGERTPHNDPHVRASFLGLGHGADAGALASAVLEGVAFAHAEGLEALRDAGSAVDELLVIGGGARSRHWGRIMAAALGVRLAYPQGAEVGAALGAARLAQIAAGDGDIAEVCTRPPLRDIIEPEADLSDRLATKFSRFRRAYAAVHTI